MKNTTKFSFLVFVIAGIVGILLMGNCNRDEDDDDPNEVKSFRLRSLTSNDPWGDNKLVFNYNAENKLSKITSGVNHLDWTWNTNNQVTLTYTYRDQYGLFQTDAEYTSLTYTNGFLSRCLHQYNDSLSETDTYSWDGDLLTRIDYETYSNGYRVYAYHSTYEYEGKLLKSAKYYIGYNGLYRYFTIEYNDTKPVAIKMYDTQNVLAYSARIIYSGNKMSNFIIYNVDQGIEGNRMCSTEWEYDTNGNPAQSIQTCESYSSTTNFIYEEGKGNIQDYILVESGWIEAYLFPGYWSYGILTK